MSGSSLANGVQSLLVAASAELIHSIDINPFICLPQGGKAVDAVIVTQADAGRKSITG